jgi:multicomponent Na+:H+ antiporter subunit G
MLEIPVALLLLIGVLGFAFTSLGVLLARDALDQIHYLAPGSLIGSVAICAAVLLHDGFSQAGVKAIFIAIILLLTNPVLSHAIARAARIRRKQDLAPREDEQIRVSKEKG